MIRAFSTTDKVYKTNGDAVIAATKARVKNEDNGDFILELICGSEYNDFIQANNIIVAPTPQGDQAFRVRQVEKRGNRIEAKCYHVFYDAENYIIADSYAYNMTAKQALEHFNTATDNTSPFTVDSDITSINNLRIVRGSLAEAVISVIERWGGHLYRDNFNVSVKSILGTDNGITIEYKKNLKELTASYDWSGVITKLLPVGKDGILIDGLYVSSATQYDIPFTKTVSFEQEIEREDYASDEAYIAALKADLRAQAQSYVNLACVPNINYTLKGNPEKVTDIGDVIEVKDARIGVNVLTKVIAYEYDAIANKYVSLEFGNFTPKLSSLMGDIKSETASQIASATSNINIEVNALENSVTILNSSINQLDNKKQDKLTAGQNISINNNVISASSIDVLYGENAPADASGKDKDFYLKFLEGSGYVIKENDYEAYSDATHPIAITSFTRISDTEYNFDITGKPSDDGNGENIFINLNGLIEGEQYTITFDAQYSSNTTFPYYPTYDTIADIINGSGVILASEILQSDIQKHSHSITFIASTVNKLHFFLSSKDNVTTTLSITDLIINGNIRLVGEIEELYNKYKSEWVKYHIIKDILSDGNTIVENDIANINTMVGATEQANGTKGLVPAPTTADKEKYLKGDGTWSTPQGASALSDLTDVEINNLTDKDIIEWDEVAEKWKNVANSGGGGTSAGVSKIETLRGRTYTEKRQSNVIPFSLLGNILTSTASSQTNSVSNIQSVQKIDVTSIDYFIITVFSLKGIANPYYPYIWLDDSDHSNDDYPTVADKFQFTSIVNNYTVYIWDVSALTGEKYFGICTGVHTEIKLSIEQSGTPKVVNQPIIYSEEEIVVGVWVDNKPLYQKCLPFNNQSSTMLSINVSALNIDKCIESSAYVNAAGYDARDYYDNSSDKLNAYFSRVNNTIDVRRGSGAAIGNGWAIIQYTKTTDVAGSGNYNTLGVPTVHYTENEQVIGTYLGKPLYQKTIIDKIPSGQLSKSVSFAGLNIQSYIDFKCLFDNTILMDIHGAIGNSSTIRITSNSQYASYGYIDDSGVTITRSNAAFYADASIKITLKYTKTTD